MAITDLFSGKSPESGISSRYDRNHKFVITRKHARNGAHVYMLENASQNQRIAIERFLFDQFRRVISELASKDNDGQKIDRKLDFKNEIYFHFRSGDSADLVSIQQMIPTLNIQGQMVILRKALPTLRDLLFVEALQHPNDLLHRIVEYHKLFQFTFAEGSESITSGLVLRKDILSDIVPFKPSRSQITGEHLKYMAEEGDVKEPKHRNQDGEDEEENKKLFQSRLADQDGDKRYRVDYEALFGGLDAADAAMQEQLQAPKRERKREHNFFPLPIHASDIKSFRKVPFRIELTQEEVQELREDFLKDRDSELYLGFEIMDGVFKSHGKLKAYRFPLYYMRVTLKESNRFIYVEPPKDGRIYLNHLAIANMVEQYAPGSNETAVVDHFFQTLLAQTIEVDRRLTRIHLSRVLPMAEEVFDKTREVLLGYESENGKGGILGHLKLLGIECDLEAAYLYKIPKSMSLMSQALEDDLDNIHGVALEYPKRFYSSLLGRFLTPEIAHNAPAPSEADKFCHRPYMPGAMPRATKSLLRKLNRHDVVLLEGPPGTGKTFTIMNLFIHAVCSGKRLLIVSDQKSALHALTEKLVDYMIPRTMDAGHAKHLDLLWKTAVRVIDELPSPEAGLGTWTRMVRTMLNLDQFKELEWPDSGDETEQEMQRIDDEINRRKSAIQQQMEKKWGKEGRGQVAPKYNHDTTLRDIKGITDFVHLMQTNDYGFRERVATFIRYREMLAQPHLTKVYNFLAVNEDNPEQMIAQLRPVLQMLKAVASLMPKNQHGFIQLTKDFAETPARAFLWKAWQAKFPEPVHPLVRFARRIRYIGTHPVAPQVEALYEIIDNQLALATMAKEIGADVLHQLQMIHQSLGPDAKDGQSLALEVAKRLIRSGGLDTPIDPKAVQDLLSDIERLQKNRDALVRKQYLGALGRIATNVFKSDEKGGTNAATRISAILEELKNKPNLDQAKAPLVELQQALFETFPIWLCRKQAVSFMLPCHAESFDLVIVDEATQCRVDDALPLLYRAKKIMVVGDDKQTVLQKDSVIDDYLFSEFDLDEHLRATQAGGIKGGGSHIFGLVKKIKQASVMLDEHYRCPPDIIQFSNRYVYHNELKVMQWTMEGSPSTVIVDYSERHESESQRRENGKFKAIETDMIDRFMEYVADTIKRIEKETGRPINIETDVAIVYFLLKNEPYIKEVKGEWLRKLGRGEDVLDGAGAALQGKERDYIFFLWDINRGNIMAFRQGDYEDKRKGELNVLMSRPKRRAYHYLHKSFDNLDHKSATITDYLWNTYSNQTKKADKKTQTERKNRPPADFRPWTRSSGQVMASLLVETLAQLENEVPMLQQHYRTQFGVIVGDPKHRIDLMLVPKVTKGGTEPSVGVVDLAGFDPTADCAEDIVDYYFQLQRAQPPIKPVFLFIHELVDRKAPPLKKLLDAIGKSDVA